MLREGCGQSGGWMGATRTGSTCRRSAGFRADRAFSWQTMCWTDARSGRGSCGTGQWAGSPVGAGLFGRLRDDLGSQLGDGVSAIFQLNRAACNGHSPKPRAEQLASNIRAMSKVIGDRSGRHPVDELTVPCQEPQGEGIPAVRLGAAEKRLVTGPTGGGGLARRELLWAVRGRQGKARPVKGHLLWASSPTSALHDQDGQIAHPTPIPPAGPWRRSVTRDGRAAP